MSMTTNGSDDTLPAAEQRVGTKVFIELPPSEKPAWGSPWILDRKNIQAASTWEENTRSLIDMRKIIDCCLIACERVSRTSMSLNSSRVIFVTSYRNATRRNLQIVNLQGKKFSRKKRRTYLALSNVIKMNECEDTVKYAEKGDSGYKFTRGRQHEKHTGVLIC
jgi:hypothetical protein